MPPPKPNSKFDVDESDSYAISQALLNFTRPNFVPRASIIKELESHLASEFTTE